MRPARLVLFLCPLVVTLGGCPTSPSGAITTRGLNVYYQVEQVGDRTSVEAYFRVGSPLGALLQLTGGDEVTVNGTILTCSVLLSPRYTGTVTAADEYVFELRRPGESPYLSTVTAPLPVDLKTPVPDVVVSRQEGFTVSWDEVSPATDYEVTLDLMGSEYCRLITSIFGDSLTRGDYGDYSYAFTADTFALTVFDDAGQPTDETEPYCEGEIMTGTLQVDSITDGEMSPDLEGRIRARAVGSPQGITVLP